MTPRLDLPCIAFHDYDSRSTMLFSLSEHKRVAGGDTDEVLRNKIVTPTARGLLLVRDPDTMATFLYNPASSDIGSHVLPYTDMRVIDCSSHDYPVLTAITIDDTVTADGSYGYSEQHPCRIFLVESDGELYMVRLLFVSPYEGGDEMDRVGVHKMDFSRRRWCSVSDLGGRAFLLSQF
ncbi:hypothetical protein C2845_PM13G16360 [Panicum miliaceum]|uniref:KIB1-4 beta-propeller domain-containing protein n=1 Tax=Panicum miliaceum TaxID=4540 RepID=A0A3L6RK05_PANMI|nr:hypothetical protein C2845_PM13G16360 [Panicum miliaceum]